MKVPLQKGFIYNDYPPFGMVMPGRSYTAQTSYRYGFNGKENSEEISEGAISFEARIYDTRIGRFFSTDPREAEYAWQSTYVYFKNCPLSVLDVLGMGDGDKPKPGSKGKVNVSFFSNDTKMADRNNKKEIIAHFDGVGADLNKDGEDDFLKVTKSANENANSETFKTFGISNIKSIGKELKKLKREGYEIGNVILNGHSNTEGVFWLGGSHSSVSVLIEQLKNKVNSGSNIILNMCNIGAGNYPYVQQDALHNLSKSIGCNVFASMSFGIGLETMFNGNSTLSTSLPASEYGGGKLQDGSLPAHSSYPDNTILFQQCYLLCRPTATINIPSKNSILTFQFVTSLKVNCTGTFTYSTETKNIFQHNRKTLEEARSKYQRLITKENSENTIPINYVQ